jgi:hypothetical protein
VQLPRLEADDPPARIGKREHQPRREVVVSARVRQPGVAQLLARKTLLPRLLGEARAGREAEPELAAGGLTEPAALEICADRLPGSRLPQVPFVKRRRLVEHRVQPLAAFA